MEQTKKVSFPMIARYNCAIRYIIENGLGCKLCDAAADDQKDNGAVHPKLILCRCCRI